MSSIILQLSVCREHECVQISVVFSGLLPLNIKQVVMQGGYNAAAIEQKRQKTEPMADGDGAIRVNGKRAFNASQ